jgi:hypothetical protein
MGRKWRFARASKVRQQSARLWIEGLESRTLLTSSISGTNVVALAGQGETLTVAKFQADATLDFASATINWGDGSDASTGTINHLPVPTANSHSDPGTISGTHTYTAAGTYTIVVTAQESGSAGNGNSATVTSTATVSAVTIMPGPVLSPTVVQGVAFQDLTVATFTTNLPGVTTDSFTATIDWADGTAPDTGTIVPAAVPMGAASSTGAVASPSVSTTDHSPIPIPTAAFVVTGSHTYITAGPVTAQITIKDTATGDSATTTANFNVLSSAPTINAQGHDFSAVVGDGTTPYIVASFTTTPHFDGSSAHYQASIDWGDGTSATPGQIFSAVLDPPGFPISPQTSAQGGSAQPLIVGLNSYVEGEHEYTKAGPYTVTVTLTGPGGASAVVTSTATVTGATTIKALGIPFNAIANQADTNQIVAVFASTDPNANAGDFTATIDWGDGATSDGSVDVVKLPPILTGSGNGTDPTAVSILAQFDGDGISLPPISLAAFQVTGTHTYTAVGSYPVSVTIADTSGNVLATTRSTATVTATSLIRAEGISFDATTNVADTGQTVAVFASTDPSATASDFTATIDWGDGSSVDTGKVIALPLPLAGSSDGSTTSPAATSVDANGDIISLPIFLERFGVTGTHTYTKADSYTVTVTISDTSGNILATTTSTATVSDATPIKAEGISFDATTNEADTDQKVAVFSSTDPSATASDFTATIDWGDGSSVDTGKVVALPSPLAGSGDASAASAQGGNADNGSLPIFLERFGVTGTHAYTKADSYTVTVTISDTSGNVLATTTSTATVSDATSITAEGISFHATTNLADTDQKVAVFLPDDSAATASDFTATIDWGDGSSVDTGMVISLPTPTAGSGDSSGTATAAATVQPGSDGAISVPPSFLNTGFAVTGTHTYTTGGSYSVTVTITDKNSGAMATTTSTATVSDEIITARPIPASLSVGQTTPAAVAGFVDSAGLSAGDFTVTIDWGDGNGPMTATVEPAPVAVPLAGGTATSASGAGGANLPVFGGSAFIVSGQPDYTATGKYTITVTITSSLGTKAVVTEKVEVAATPPTVTPTPTGENKPIFAPPVPTSTSPTSTTPTTDDPTSTSNGGDPTPTDPPTTSTGPVVLAPTSTVPVVLGASHPGKGGKKHHSGLKGHGAKPYSAPPAHPAIAKAKKGHKP